RFDLGTLLACLEDMPADPENEAENHHQDFPSLKGIDRTDVLEIDGPVFHSIGRHRSSPFGYFLPDHGLLGPTYFGDGGLVRLIDGKIDAFELNLRRHAQETK